MGLDLSVAALALALAAALRPWRALAPGVGPPWPWVVTGLALSVLWSADRWSHSPIVQPLSGAPLLVLLAGWPAAMLALVPAALLTAWLGDLAAVQAVQRLVWLGVVPGTLALAGGLCVRRWLPRHLFVYILGRGFGVTWLAAAAAGALSAALHDAPAGLAESELLVARWLAASGEAFLTGMLAAIFVAFRPHWLATYSDRRYLPGVAKP